MTPRKQTIRVRGALSAAGFRVSYGHSRYGVGEHRELSVTSYVKGGEVVTHVILDDPRPGAMGLTRQVLAEIAGTTGTVSQFSERTLLLSMPIDEELT